MIPVCLKQPNFSGKSSFRKWFQRVKKVKIKHQFLKDFNFFIFADIV